MSTTVTYKGNTLTTATNQTKTLETAGKQMEDDVTITDVTQNIYWALITNTGSSTNSYVEYDGIKYVDLRDTFSYSGGESLVCHVGTSTQKSGIYINDELIAGGGTSAVDYTITLPQQNTEISLVATAAQKTIHIDYPVRPDGFADTTKY